MNIGCKGLFLFLAATMSVMPMKGNTQPSVRIIVYADDSLLETLESPRIEEWLAETRKRCGCRLESIQPAPGKAWVFGVPERPDDSGLEALLDCIRRQKGVRDAERDRMLQPTQRGGEFQGNQS